MYSITFGAGVLLLFMGIFLLYDRIDFIKSGTVTEATVIKLQKEFHSEGPEGYAPVFRFIASNKEEIIFQHTIATDPPSWSIGEKAKVVYRKGTPHDVIVLTYFGAFGVVVILLGAALVCLTISIGYYWSRKFLKSLT